MFFSNTWVFKWNVEPLSLSPLGILRPAAGMRSSNTIHEYGRPKMMCMACKTVPLRGLENDIVVLANDFGQVWRLEHILVTWSSIDRSLSRTALWLCIVRDGAWCPTIPPYAPRRQSAPSRSRIPGDLWWKSRGKRNLCCNLTWLARIRYFIDQAQLSGRIHATIVGKTTLQKCRILY